MPPKSDATMEPNNSARWFVTTHWSVVLSAKNGAQVQADVALEQLCQTYWWPLYAFVRRRGHGPHDAEDTVQEFFRRLLAKDFLHSVERNKGKFRTFLLAALEHFLLKEWYRAKAQKRGGKFTFVSLDVESAEQQYLQVQAPNLSPEQVFDQQWALTLFGEVLDRLRKEFVKDGESARFEAIKTFLTVKESAGTYARLATELGTTKAALKMAVSRLRKRFRKLLLAEIGNTVRDPQDIDEELRALSRALCL